MKCNVEIIEDHYIRAHDNDNRHFQEFQCFYCEIGYNTVDEIRRHMSENHPSKFLFVGARWNCSTAKNEVDEIQIVYIGNSKDFSTYQLYKCSNLDALNCMNPQELCPIKQLEMQQNLHTEYSNLKSEYCRHEQLSTISYQYTGKFANELFIAYADYVDKKAKE